MTVLMIVLALVIFGLAYFLQREQTRRLTLVVAIFLLMLVTLTYESYFVRPYPKTADFHKENSIQIASLSKWFNIDGRGLLYIKDLQVIDNRYLRIYFRQPGFTKTGLQDFRLFDDTGKENGQFKAL